RCTALCAAPVYSRSGPRGPFSRSAHSSIPAPGRSGHSLAPLAHRFPLPAARAIRSLRSLIDSRSRPLGPFARSARSSEPPRDVVLGPFVGWVGEHLLRAVVLDEHTRAAV